MTYEGFLRAKVLSTPDMGIDITDVDITLFDLLDQEATA